MRLVSPDPPDAVAGRLRAAIAEPLETAIDDHQDLKMTARPGEPRLVGRLEGTQVSAWR